MRLILFFLHENMMKLLPFLKHAFDEEKFIARMVKKAPFCRNPLSCLFAAEWDSGGSSLSIGGYEVFLCVCVMGVL